MDKYTVQYKSQLAKVNGTVQRDGYSEIIFRNQGSAQVVVDNGIRINPGDVFFLRNDPGQLIDNSFVYQFETFENEVNELIIIRKYFIQ